KSQMPGVSARIFENGKAHFEFDSGTRALGTNVKVERADLWHIGSCTKPMTAVLIAQLVDEKKLSWSTKVSEIFKTHSMAKDVGEITIEEILAHRSGLEDIAKLENGALWPKLFDPKLEVAKARRMLVDGILKAELIAPHGTKTEYSNSGYVLLGAIIEKIRKTSWESATEERIFKPLSMNSCGFGPAGKQNLNRPTQPWGHLFSKDKLTAIRPDENADNPRALGPAGTIHCSSDDVAKFFSMLGVGFKEKQDTKVLKSSSLEKLLSASADPVYTHMSLGRHEREWAKGTSFAMAGSNTFNYTIIGIAPGTGRTFVVNTNSATAAAENGVIEIFKELTGAH
ncbi:MAG: serine hydrolase domain-containing protein, partial [Bdellovibrionota bacterium]